jgi:RimJ/RimL family protein N-acetyltransferase
MPAEPFLAAALDVPDEAVGARVVVRPYERADAPALKAAVEESRDHLRPWMPWADTHQRIEETLDFCAGMKARWIRREAFSGGIFLRADGHLVGGAGLQSPNWEARGFEIGYWLRASATGHGYVREAAAALSRFAFEWLDAERVVIRCDANNARSAHVAESLGYTLEGRLRHDSRTPSGELRDTLVFALLRAEYDPTRPGWRELFD